jgi:phospholipase C
MSPQLWPYALTRFSHFDAFQSACASGSLPQYSFLEPSFVDKTNDEHPPHDVVAGEQFLWAIWPAVSQSSAWQETLLLITYGEHGGRYDHVMPCQLTDIRGSGGPVGPVGFTVQAGYRLRSNFRLGSG